MFYLMRVIVMGGTGWVGHNIVRQFHAAGHEVTIFSRGRKTSYEADIPAEILRIRGDKNSASDMARVFETRYDVVIDSVPVEESIDNVVKHAAGLKQYVHCSSTGGYAPLPVIPGDETIPYSHYRGGWADKGIVDAKVLRLYASSGFPATVIRPPYINGPGLLPLDNLGGRREDFIPDILNGVTLDLPDAGMALLQPVHVVDLAKAFLLAAQTPKSIGEIYNVCLDKAVTLERHLEINAEAVGAQAKINFMSVDAMLQKYGDSVSEIGLRYLAEHCCYDITKARTQLGYEPQCSTEEAIVETARWARDHAG